MRETSTKLPPGMTMTVEVHDIVQLDPEKTKNPIFAGALMIVTEIKSWGVQGYVEVLGNGTDDPSGQAYYRAENGTFEPTGGKAVWVQAGMKQE